MKNDLDIGIASTWLHDIYNDAGDIPQQSFRQLYMEIFYRNSI